MVTIGALEARSQFSALLERVEQGEQVGITRHGRLIARLVSVRSPDRQRTRETIEKLKAFSADNTLGALDWRELRDEGRR